MKINYQTYAELKGQELKDFCITISPSIRLIRFPHTAIALTVLTFKKLTKEPFWEIKPPKLGGFSCP